MGGPGLLELQGVCSGYSGLPVLFDIDLSVAGGELLTVLGGNGAGKSTLLKTVLGDVTASAGEIVFEGERITRLPAYRRVTAGISYSPEGRRIFPNLSVRENLLAGSFGIVQGDLADQLAFVHELFPLLADRARQRAGTLSGGEQQMLAIGRALMPRPRLLMVEEISLGLAPVIVSHLYRALRVLCDRGLAVMISEQFQRFEPEFSDRWLVLERGTVLTSGDRSDAHRLHSVTGER